MTAWKSNPGTRTGFGGVPGRYRQVPHRHKRSLAFALLGVLLLCGPVILAGVGISTSEGPSEQVPLRAEEEPLPGEALRHLFNALPPGLSGEAALGPAADFLRPGPDGELRGAPESVTDALDIVRKQVPYERLPIPDPPRTEEPLLFAVGAFARVMDVDLPVASDLRNQIRDLRLQDEGEQALARLLLAYTQATELEKQALESVREDQLAILDRDPDAIAAWLSEEATRTQANLEDHVKQISGLVDFSKRLQATDLLLRTIEEVKDDIALPPVEPPAWPDTGDPDWDQVYTLIGGVTGFHPALLPPLPKEGLVEALENLAMVMGAGPVEVPSIDHIPPSLADAVAHIVTARHVGLTLEDPAAHTFLLMEATRTVQPTLEAWAAIMDLQAAHAAFASSESDLRGLLQGIQTPADASPAVLLAQAKGVDLPRDVPEPPSLALLLEREGVDPQEAQEAARALPPELEHGTAIALDALQRFEAERERVLGGLDPDIADIVLHETDAVLGLVASSSWLPPEAVLVKKWAQGMGEIGPQGMRDLQQAQVDALAGVEAAVAVLKGFAEPTEGYQGPPSGGSSGKNSGKILGFIPRISLIQTASAQGSDSGCPAASPLSMCSQDVWLRSEAGRGILLTGFGSTTIGMNVIGVNPGLVIDLGGDDTYRHAVGAVQESEDLAARVAIDLGGDDLYVSDQRLAHGAASGLGTLGVLWNVEGDDTYRHACLIAIDCTGAQGFGTSGGVGILVDEAGSDTYEATQSWAHGVGRGGDDLPMRDDSGSLNNQAQNIPTWLTGVSESATGTDSVGMLLGRGAGDDVLFAGQGQGYATGRGAMGLLLNDDGTNSYTTQVGNPRYQGGHNPGDAAIGILVDMGGAGTWYSNMELSDPEDYPLSTWIYASDRPDDRVRRDDALWLEVSHSPLEDPEGVGLFAMLPSEEQLIGAGAGFGLGLDSTMEDESGNGVPNLVALLLDADMGGLEDRVMEILETDPEDLDPEDLDPEELLSDLLLRDDSLCYDEQCETPMSLLHLGGTADNEIHHPALIMIELGGNNAYFSEVAGPGNFWLGGVQVPGPGSISLDLSGDDVYHDPGTPTQASVELVPISGDLLEPADYNVRSRVSLLLNFDGDDEYHAQERSQASVWNDFDDNPTSIGASAWLIDFAGNDTYVGGDRSQAFADAMTVSSTYAGLIDLQGGDNYEFNTQARAVSGGGLATPGVSVALVFDGGGRDTYNSTNADPDFAFTGSEDSAFRTQAISSGSGRSVAIFMDQGPDFDRYFVVDESGDMVDVSHIKNNVTHGGFIDNPGSDPPEQLSVLPDLNPEDEDGDGAPTVVESLLGTDSHDPEDHPGSVWSSPERLAGQLSDPGNITQDDLMEAIGTESDDSWLRIPENLLIGGRGDSVYDEVYAFQVSLGGNNTYTDPRIGGMTSTAGTSLLLDVGGGDNLYAPDPGGCTLESVETAITRVCPSLGGAAGGIAIVADTGGNNVFRTQGKVEATTSGSRTFDLVTQGAGVDLGIGVLLTWNATNRFEANLSVDLTQQVPVGVNNPPISLTVRGVAQGASVGGFGLLANFGQGNNTYSVNLSAKGGENPVKMGVAQGATGANPMQGAFVQNIGRVSSFGLLLDGGGTNEYFAPDGFAQGFAFQGGFPISQLLAIPPTTYYGVLWTGTGDDRFEATRFSQGASLGGPHLVIEDGEYILTTLLGNVLTLEEARGTSVGLLYNAGGNNEYHVMDVAGPAFSQGAGMHGVGLLIDVTGEDLYQGGRSTHVQGVGVEGIGALLDLGGHDTYRASAKAQGYVADQIEPQEMPTFAISDPVDGMINDVSGTIGDELGPMEHCLMFACRLPAMGLLFDLHGNDQYILEGAGQGLAEVSECSSFYVALLVDASGQDRYVHGGTKESLQDSESPGDENDWAWTQTGSMDIECGFGGGIDSSEIDEVYAHVRDISPVGVDDVVLRVWDSTGSIVGGVTGGLLTLRAEVAAQPQDPSIIHRVSFSSDSRLLGVGDFSHEEEGLLIYTYTLDTASPDVLDGTLTLHASAYLDLSAGTDAGVVGPAELPSTDSAPVTVTIDNPPLVDAHVDGRLLSPPLGQTFSLMVDIGPDFDWPDDPNVGPGEVCGEGEECLPGGYLRVSLINVETGELHVPVAEYRAAGLHEMNIAPVTDGDSWEDGEFGLMVEVTDGRDQSTVLDLETIVVDGSPPRSWITTPEFAGTQYSLPGSRLELHFQHTDEAGSGVTDLCLFQLDVDGGPVTSSEFPVCLGPGSKAVQVSDVSAGNQLRFVTVAIDKAGNPESPCLPGETLVDPASLCFEKKAADPTNVAVITADFAPPVISEIRVNGMEPVEVYVRPGDKVNISARVTDVGTGVDLVTVRLPGDTQVAMETDGGGRYWFNGWHLLNAELHEGQAREEAYVIRVTALDHAGNAATPAQRVSWLDSLPPRVMTDVPDFPVPALRTLYFESDGQGEERQLPSGRGGIDAVLHARVWDASVASVWMNVSDVAVGGTMQPCVKDTDPTGQPDVWTCRVTLSPDLDDGDYWIPVLAVDAAGNENNTQFVHVEINSVPPEFHDVEVVKVLHDGFRINWTSPTETTGTIHFGRTLNLGQKVAGASGQTEHSVLVTGLTPSSRYHFQLEAESAAGVTNVTPIFQVTTLNAYLFDLLDTESGRSIGGMAEFGYNLTLHAGDSPVRVTVFIQDAAGTGSPFEVASFLQDEGEDSLKVDMTRFADGDHRLIFELDRAGDFARFHSPVFHIDNTEPVVIPIAPQPESSIAQTKPDFEVYLIDPMGRSAPVLETLRVEVDDTLVNHTVLIDEVDGSGPQRRVVFTLDDDPLPQGTNVVNVSVSDAAGNTGIVGWTFNVDHLPPRLDEEVTIRPLPGPDHLKPGGSFEVSARVVDHSPVASVEIDLGPISGDLVPLLANGDGTWSAQATVPADAPHGVYDLPLLGADALGNKGQIGFVEVTVDAKPVEISRIQMTDVGYTSVTFTFTTDKPARTGAGTDDPFEDDDWDTAHRVLVTGFVPGENHTIELRAVDRAGHLAQKTVHVTTLVDTEPPTPVGDLRALSTEEGNVELTWAAATDNAGISHYVVERSSAPRAQGMEKHLPMNTTSFRDTEAPAGRTVEYLVTAVDVAGLEGPSMQTRIEVLGVPRLSEAKITPLHGPSSEPFTFQVMYNHPGDQLPDTISVVVDGVPHPMTREGRGPCHDGCSFQAQVPLPPSSTFGAVKEATIEVVTGGQRATLVIHELPFVYRGGEAGWIQDHSQGLVKESSAPGVIVILASIALSLLLIPQRRRYSP